MKTMVKLIAAALTAAALLAAALPVAAAKSHIFDLDNSLTAAEEQELNEAAEEFTRQYKMDIVVVITDDIYGVSPKEFSDTFYDSMGFSDDGILLLVNNDTKIDWASTTGKAMDIFFEERIDAILEAAGSEFADGNYYTGVKNFIAYSNMYMESPSTGAFMGGDMPILILSSVGVGIVVAVIAFAMIKASYKEHKTIAVARYIEGGGLDYAVKKDLFLHTIRKTRRSESSSVRSSGTFGGGFRGGGGGFRGGGRSHGGGGRAR